MQMLEFINTSGPEPWKNENAKKFVRSHAMKDFRRKQREVTKRRKDDQSQPGEGSFVLLTNKKPDATGTTTRRSPKQAIAAASKSANSATSLITPTATLGEIAGLKTFDHAKFLYSLPLEGSPIKSCSILPQIFPMQDAFISRLPSPSPSISSSGTSGSSPGALSRSLPQDFHLSICKNVYQALDAAGANYGNFTQLYFTGVHAYLTIIHRRRFFQNVYALSKKANGDIAILLLCMRLVAEPATSGICLDGGDLYTTAKRLFKSVYATNGPSLALVQAGSLLVTYEHNAYMRQASYDTLIECCNMATAIGLNALPKEHKTVHEEERRRVYWGLLSLDCTVALHDEKHDRQLLLPVPSPDDVLPSISDTEFDNAVDETPSTGIPFLVQSKLPTWAESFCRQGQSVRLMYMVQRILREPFEESRDLMISRIQHLDGLIISQLTHTLSDCNKKYTQYCGPISLLIDASYLLHECQLKSTMASIKISDVQATLRSKMAIETMIEMMVNILREFPVSHTPELSPAALFGPYMAVMLGLQLDRIKGLRQPPTLGGNVFELMVNGLRHFSTVWPCTGEYVKLIERAQSRSLPMPLLSI